MLWNSEDKQLEAKRLRDRLEGVEGRLVALTAAFDKFFDVVAEDLGLEAAKEWRYICGMQSSETRLSPRQLAEDVTPETCTVKRKATARCPKGKPK